MNLRSKLCLLTCFLSFCSLSVAIADDFLLKTVQPAWLETEAKMRDNALYLSTREGFGKKTEISFLPDEQLVVQYAGKGPENGLDAAANQLTRTIFNTRYLFKVHQQLDGKYSLLLHDFLKSSESKSRASRLRDNVTFPVFTPLRIGECRIETFCDSSIFELVETKREAAEITFVGNVLKDVPPFLTAKDRFEFHLQAEYPYFTKRVIQSGTTPGKNGLETNSYSISIAKSSEGAPQEFDVDFEQRYTEPGVPVEIQKYRITKLGRPQIQDAELFLPNYGIPEFAESAPTPSSWSNNAFWILLIAGASFIVVGLWLKRSRR